LVVSQVCRCARTSLGQQRACKETLQVAYPITGNVRWVRNEVFALKRNMQHNVLQPFKMGLPDRMQPTTKDHPCIDAAEPPFVLTVEHLARLSMYELIGS
jgi:hypothetical protein